VPVSHKLQAIFIHIPKTAGTSVTRCLADLDPDLALLGQTTPDVRALTDELWSRHLGAAQVQAVVDSKIWPKYFKFAFVRNPYDLVVSHFFFQKRLHETAPHVLRSLHPDISSMLAAGCGFSEWLKAATYIKPQSFYVLDEQGKVIVDFLGKFETMNADFAHVCKVLNIEVKLPHLLKTAHLSWDKYYDRETSEIIHRRFAKDFAPFGYKTMSW
jgi:chondroitin 4-sulfotransferase 11